MGSTCKQGKPNGTKKRGGTALGRRRSKKRRLAQLKEGALEAHLIIRERGKGGEIGDRERSYKPARPRGIKRSFPVLTWISGDGIRRIEATSSRGRSLAIAHRLAVSLTTAKRLPSAKKRKGNSPLEPHAGELARAVLRGASRSRPIPIPIAYIWSSI